VCVCVQDLIEMVQYPIEYPDIYMKYGQTPSRVCDSLLYISLCESLIDHFSHVCVCVSCAKCALCARVRCCGGLPGAVRLSSPKPSLASALLTSFRLRYPSYFFFPSPYQRFPLYTLQPPSPPRFSPFSPLSFPCRPHFPPSLSMLSILPISHPCVCV